MADIISPHNWDIPVEYKDDWYADFKSLIQAVGDTIGWVNACNYTTLELANTAAYNAGKLLLITQNYTLTADTTLTAAVQVIKGGRFTKASTYTLAINGPFEAGLYQVFFGFSAGDVTFATGTIDEAKVSWFETLNVAAGAYKILRLSSGDTPISTSLNLSGQNPGHVIRGGGVTSRVVWYGNTTGPIIDCSGSIFTDFSDFQVYAPIGNPVAIGILYSRIGVGSADCHTLERVTVDGYYTKTPVYQLTSERFEMIDCVFTNRAAVSGSFAFVREQLNTISATSPYQTLIASNGNTVGRMIGCEIYHYGTGSGMKLHGTYNFRMPNTYVYVANGAAAVVLANGCKELDLDGLRVEGVITNSILLSDAGSYTFSLNGAGLTAQSVQIAGVTNAIMDRCNIWGTDIDTATTIINVHQMIRSNVRGGNIVVTGSAYHNRIQGGTEASITLPAAKSGNLITYTDGNDEKNNGYLILNYANIKTYKTPVSNNILEMNDPTAYGINVGAKIGLGGIYDSNGTYSLFGGVGVVKETAADANSAGATVLYAHPSGGAVFEVVRATSGGDWKLLTNGKGIVIKNAAGTVTKRVRLNDIGDGLIFEAE